ncbi:uncharacterized protein [Pocillopora verrucosa]|uniref:uncharacterized protein isoform X1 n=2 Tax=Pocillopora verrucosa TaxID=203993 RepID=UPI00333E91A2
MSNSSNQPAYQRFDTAEILAEFLDSPSDHHNLVTTDSSSVASPNFLSQLVMHNEPQYLNPLQPGCPSPPDSERTNTPSPFATHTVQTRDTLPDGNFLCEPLIPSAGPSGADLRAPCQYQTFSLPRGRVGGTNFARYSDRRVQVTHGHCNEANIKILNPRAEYDKVQRKHGHRGKFSEQRVAKGKVEMEIDTQLPLRQLEVYVLRDFEAEKKLVAKDPKAYGVGEIRFLEKDVQEINTPGQNSKYVCKIDLDSVYKTEDGKEIYRLEKTRGLEYNRFFLKVFLELNNGQRLVLFPYEFVLKSSKTVKVPREPQSVLSPQTACSLTSPRQVPPDSRYESFICQQIEADIAKIKDLEVEQIKTANHDIAYYVKRQNESQFEEGDVVGFFERKTGGTVIDFLTSDNAHEARLAGVISRSAYLVGNTGQYDEEEDDADLVCIIGQIKVKVIGEVRPGQLVYACPSNKFPGVAIATPEQGDDRRTLIGYAMGGSSGPGVSKVDCIVSLVLSIGAQEQLRALDQMRLSIEEVRENLYTSIDTVGFRIARMQRGWRGLWKKLLAVTVFLAIASVVCALMLAPSSPYVKAKCRANSIKDHTLTFKFYPKDSDDEVIVKGLEFTWEKLKKKLSLRFDKRNGTEKDRYFLNKIRCETGGIRSVASWLDPSPVEPKVNVLAVDPACERVFYHSRKDGKWQQYHAVEGVHCHPASVH